MLNLTFDFVLSCVDHGGRRDHIRFKVVHHLRPNVIDRRSTADESSLTGDGQQFEWGLEANSGASLPPSTRLKCKLMIRTPSVFETGLLRF